MSDSAKTVHLVLHASAMLDQPHVRLAELANISSPDSTLQQQLAACVVTRAPLVGQATQMTRPELENILRSRVPALTQLSWSGAQAVQMHRRGQPLDAGQVADTAVQFLRNALTQQYPQAQVEVALATALPLVDVPTGSVMLRPRPLAQPPLQARMVVWIDVIANGAVYRSVLVPLTVSARQTVHIARHPMADGDVITLADVAASVEEITGLRDTVAAAPSLAAAPRLRQPLAAGQIVMAAQLAPQDMVLRGDRVRLIVGVPGILIEKIAYAQADAGMGQHVLVQPGQGRETVSARVVAAGIVEIDGK
ncbi:flagellar basal body P-ring formation chaperone FlgA [Janthinobacterium sp. GB4P2]|uniref:flagellar basal body P-ring formation chaperone FlgA n=1 Tax=Janthinobacterium sp. GB4P2 TaxID=3424189 RepID=UPI003F1EECBA